MSPLSSWASSAAGCWSSQPSSLGATKPLVPFFAQQKLSVEKTAGGNHSFKLREKSEVDRTPRKRMMASLFHITHAKFLIDQEINPTVLRQRGRIKSRLLAGTAFIVGVLLAVGGTGRWRDQSLELAMSFNGSSTLLGVLLMLFASVMTCGIVADHAKMLVLGCWGCASWCWLMGVFALFKLAAAPTTVDDIAFALWMFLGLDFLINAQSHLSWDTPSD